MGATNTGGCQKSIDTREVLGETATSSVYVPSRVEQGWMIPERSLLRRGAVVDPDVEVGVEKGVVGGRVP